MITSNKARLLRQMDVETVVSPVVINPLNKSPLLY